MLRNTIFAWGMRSDCEWLEGWLRCRFSFQTPCAYHRHETTPTTRRWGLDRIQERARNDNSRPRAVEGTAQLQSDQLTQPEPAAWNSRRCLRFPSGDHCYLLIFLANSRKRQKICSNSGKRAYHCLRRGSWV